MDQAYISTFAALGGTVVGGLASFATAWVTQSLQSRYARVTADIARREHLYGSFMDELALLFSHALRSDEVDYAKLVSVFALRGRITLIATQPVIDSARAAVEFLIDIYIGPKRTPQEVREMMDKGTADIIGTFAHTCREEFRILRLA
jgi:hypothetical protein